MANSQMTQNAETAADSSARALINLYKQACGELQALEGPLRQLVEDRNGEAVSPDLQGAFSELVFRFTELRDNAVYQRDAVGDLLYAARRESKLGESLPEYNGRPATLSPVPLATEDILVITKASKVQYDMLKRNLSFTELREAYVREGADPDRIFDSHQRQLEAAEKLRQKIPASRIVSWDADPELVAEKVKSARLIVGFGGDNHFQRVSHFSHGDTMVAGVNSDPETSRGALLFFSADSFLDSLEKLQKGDYRLQPWTRLKVSVNGQFMGSATCDIFLGETERQYMSRYILELGDIRQEQKSSGLVVATGSGSTGWFSSAMRQFTSGSVSFPRDAGFARFVSTEISATGSTNSPQGVLTPGRVMRVHSLNDSDGIIALDSLINIPFPRGAVADIEIDSEPLWVVSLKEQEA